MNNIINPNKDKIITKKESTKKIIKNAITKTDKPKTQTKTLSNFVAVTDVEYLYFLPSKNFF